MTPEEWSTIIKLAMAGALPPFAVAFFFLASGRTLTRAHHEEVVALKDQQIHDLREELNEYRLTARISNAIAEQVADQMERQTVPPVHERREI